MQGNQSVVKYRFSYWFSEFLPNLKGLISYVREIACKVSRSCIIFLHRGEGARVFLEFLRERESKRSMSSIFSQERYHNSAVKLTILKMREVDSSYGNYCEDLREFQFLLCF